MMVSAPGFQPAGQTSPCLSVYMNAWAKGVILRKVLYCRICVLRNVKPELGGEFHPHFFQQGDHSWWFAWKGEVEIQTQKITTIIDTSECRQDQWWKVLSKCDHSPPGRHRSPCWWCGWGRRGEGCPVCQDHPRSLGWPSRQGGWSGSQLSRLLPGVEHTTTCAVNQSQHQPRRQGPWTLQPCRWRQESRWDRQR